MMTRMCRPSYGIKYAVPFILVWLVAVGCQWLPKAGPTAAPSATPTRPLSRLGLVAFVAVNVQGQAQIYVMRADGSEWINLTPGPGYHCCAAWSPDGKRIAFWSAPDDGSDGWYITDLAGSTARQITHGLEGMNTPTWSPDGKRIAFTMRIPVGEGYNDEIGLVDLGSEKVDNLTRHPSHDVTPAWAPDGKKIAFASDRDEGIYQIYITSPEGSGVERLTDEPGGAEQPAWSPDGRRIAYTCYRGGNSRICVMNADGSGSVQLRYDEEFGNGYHPSWSPDGLHIVYRSTWRDRTNLFVMDADGSNALRVTDLPQGPVLSADVPTWQPVLPP